ncbi:alpha/beta fold hydrolase [Helicobacter trogontum]|uniref:Alpha/beta fold hydrolase n=1 Tax=Helicobacter trogontum TaxID=50960 RepID=A0A4U8S9E7_9HELI|nr:alpha/beta fold hydrolase [Helicobacter trogontum]TLD82585.1 alpha/beta fold hydrolase [Helicobacter trogontum]
MEFAIRDFYTNFLLATNEIPNQYFTLIGFFENTIKNIIGDNKIVVTGHSLGGFFAQSFTLAYPDRIKEVYTYNSPGLLPDDRKYIAEGTKIAIGVTNKLYKAVKDIKNGNLKSAITSSSEAVDTTLSYSLFSDRYDYRAFIVTNELKSLKFIDGLFDKNQNILPYHVTNAILESYNFGSSCLFFGYGVYVCLHCF